MNSDAEPPRLLSRRSLLDWMLGTSTGALLLSIAYPVGIGFAAGAAALISSSEPLFEMRAFEPAQLAQALGVTLLLAGAGALAPLRSIRDADPALAFQES
jgi:hypothetical protein